MLAGQYLFVPEGWIRDERLRDCCDATDPVRPLAWSAARGDCRQALRQRIRALLQETVEQCRLCSTHDL